MVFFSWVAYQLLFLVENFRLHSMKFEQKINVLLMGIVNATCAYSQMLLNSFHCVCVFYIQFSSVAQLCPTLRPHGLQHARPPCSSPTPGVYSNSCPFLWWCHPTISSSAVPFFSHLQSFPALGSFQVSLFFASGGQSIRISASASVLPMNIQDWFPLGWTGWISLESKSSQSR